MANIPEINIIVAMTENGLIGKGAGLPWKSSIDMKHFAKTTTGWPVIFGKNTADGMKFNFPLKNRPCIILSRTVFAGPNANWFVFGDIDRAIRQFSNFEKIFIAGGASVYKYALERGIVDNIYKTVFHDKLDASIKRTVEGDVYLGKDALAKMEGPCFQRLEQRVYEFASSGEWYVDNHNAEGKLDTAPLKNGDTPFSKIIFEKWSRTKE
jgi:dihydrofolate reductase